MISLVIALYNEENRFPDRYKVLREFLDALEEPWELILVDDGSRDGTGALIKGLAAKDKRLRTLRLHKNCGQGAAVKAGILASRGDVVLYADADLAIPLRWLSALIERVRAGADVAVASRWIAGAVICAPQPAARRNLGKVYYAIVHSLVFDGVQDTNCGLKAYRGEAARLVFGFVRSWRWVFNVEHLWLARRMGFTIAEIPIEWSHSAQSKVHVLRDCVFTLWELALLKLRQLMRGYPGLSAKA
ncbi:MAG: glycosyltransferase [Elusimicrobia bacterium]|nr:glycosyltransferase [Elusimicrobiota bacterium]